MRVRWRARLLPLCITLGAGYGARIDYLASSPMLDCFGLPCVDVTAGGNTHFKMLVDTGT